MLWCYTDANKQYGRISLRLLNHLTRVGFTLVLKIRRNLLIKGL